MYWVENESLKQILGKWAENHPIFLPQKSGDFWEWQRFSEEVQIDFGGYRTILPPKYFFYKLSERLELTERKPSIIAGIRGCDIRGLQLLKTIYLDEPEDPYFRKENIIITADCSCCDKNCFCTLLGGAPYATEGFDLNFTQLEDGVLIEVGSARGEELLSNFKDLLSTASEDQINERNELRERVTAEVNANTDGLVFDLDKLKEAIETNSEVFEREGAKCVSCSACTNICPGCFCFLLGETNVQDGISQKVRYLDSCQFVGYARVGGGDNPRKDITKRFKHRFLCKFSYRADMQGMLGCTGCGRCTDGCQGGIKFKQVLLDVYQAENKEVVGAV